MTAKSDIQDSAKGDPEAGVPGGDPSWVVLAEIGRIASSSPRAEDIFHPFVEQFRKLVEFDRIDIALIDHQSWTFRRAYVSGVNLPGDDRPDPTPLAGTNKEHIVRTGATVLIGEHNFQSLIHRVPSMKEPVAAGLRSAIAVPLAWRGSIVGVLTIRSRRPNAYADSNVTTVARVAAEISGAIAIGEMYKALERDARERTVIAELGRIIGSSLHLDDVYERFVVQLKQLIPFDRIAIFSIDPETGNKSRNYIYGPEVPGWNPGVGVQPGPLTMLAMERGAGVIRHVGQVYPENHPHPWEDLGTSVGLKSALAVPLVQRGRVIGAMCLRTRVERAYAEGDLRLAERVATQMSGAITNAHLHAALQKEMIEKTLLANVWRAASEAGDSDQLIDHVNQSLSKLIAFDRLQLELLDPRTNSLAESFVRGLEVVGISGRDKRIELAGGQETWSEIFAEQNGSVVAVAGLSSHEIAALRKAGIRSWAQAPLRTRNGVFGCLALQSKKENAFTERDSGLLQQVAALVAPVIETFQLRHLLRQAERERKFLSTIRDRAGPSGTPTQYFHRLARIIAEVVPYDFLAVSALDSQTGKVRCAFSDGIDPVPEGLAAKLPAEGSLTELISTRRSGQIVGSVPASDEPLIGAVRESGGPAESYASGMSLPLLLTTSVSFVLHLRSRVARAYREADLALLEQVALSIAPFLEMIAKSSAVPVSAVAQGPRLITRMDGTAMLKVVLVDDNQLCRNGLVHVFEGAGVHVAAAVETRTAGPAVRRIGPRVVVYDVHGDDAFRPGVVAAIKNAHADACVLVTSERADQTGLFAAIRAGVDGFVLKNGSPTILAQAVEQVAAGSAVIDSSLFKGFVEDLGGTIGGLASGYRQKLEALTDRDRDILAAVALGKSNAEIAQTMHLAVGTVRNRLVEIYRTMDVSDRAEAVYIATRAGLVQ